MHTYYNSSVYSTVVVYSINGLIKLLHNKTAMYVQGSGHFNLKGLCQLKLKCEGEIGNKHKQCHNQILYAFILFVD